VNRKRKWASQGLQLVNVLKFALKLLRVKIRERERERKREKKIYPPNWKIIIAYMDRDIHDSCDFLTEVILESIYKCHEILYINIYIYIYIYIR
jgi:hypothetical protein